MLNRFLDIDGGLLLTLDALFREKNVTHAADRLGITQPALSARLTRLRAMLEDPLFTPAASGRGMVPTPHALAMQPELARLLDRLNDFANVALAFDPATSTRIFRIAATDNPAAILAPDLIPEIKLRAPSIRLAFVFPDKARISSHLQQGEIDLFIGAPGDTGSGMMGRTLFDDAFVTAQRRGHPRGKGPLDLDTFCQLEHLLISSVGGNFSGVIDSSLANLGRSRRVAVSIQSYALAPVVLAQSDFLCTLPRRFLQKFTDALELFQPPLTLQNFQLNAFWHERMNNDPAHVWLREQVFEVARVQGRT